MYAGSNPASGNFGIAKRLSNRKVKVRILHVFNDTLTQLVEYCTVNAAAGQTAPECSLLKMNRKKSLSLAAFNANWIKARIRNASRPSQLLNELKPYCF